MVVVVVVQIYFMVRVRFDAVSTAVVTVANVLIFRQKYFGNNGWKVH